MNKTRFYQLLSVILLLCNIGLMVFLWVNKPPHPPTQPKQFIIDKLDLNASQIIQYEQLIISHQQAIKAKVNSLKTTKKAYYQTLVDTAVSAQKEQRLNDLMTIHRSIEQTNFEHFDSIKAICMPEQLEAYKVLLTELPNLFIPSQRPRPPFRK